MHGYVRAFDEAGVELPENAFVVAPATIEGGIASLRGAWEDGLRPTGVLAMSDAMAIGVLRAARELGLRVPQDLSVVGFDDIDISQHTNPPLTTVHQPIREKGEIAVRACWRRSIDLPREESGSTWRPASSSARRPGHPRPSTRRLTAAGGGSEATLTNRQEPMEEAEQ